MAVTRGVDGGKHVNGLGWPVVSVEIAADGLGWPSLTDMKAGLMDENEAADATSSMAWAGEAPRAISGETSWSHQIQLPRRRSPGRSSDREAGGLWIQERELSVAEGTIESRPAVGPPAALAVSPVHGAIAGPPVDGEELTHDASEGSNSVISDQYLEVPSVSLPVSVQARRPLPGGRADLGWPVDDATDSRETAGWSRIAPAQGGVGGIGELHSTVRTEVTDDPPIRPSGRGWPEDAGSSPQRAGPTSDPSVAVSAPQEVDSPEADLGGSAVADRVQRETPDDDGALLAPKDEAASTQSGVAAWLREPAAGIDLALRDRQGEQATQIERAGARETVEPVPGAGPTEPDEGAEAAARIRGEATTGWTSWREVNANATDAALSAMMIDPLDAARRLLGGGAASPSVSRETSPGTPEAGAGPSSAALAERMIPAERETPVSRETPTNETDPEVERAETGIATVTGGLATGQTASQSREDAIDGSTAMREVSDGDTMAAGVRTADAGYPPTTVLDVDHAAAALPPGHPLSPATPYENDEQRRHLVGSLPSVDDSTPLAVEVREDARRRISLVGRPFPAPPRTRVLTVANQKGGVGKTTTTVNVAAAMAQAGLTVLVLDIDPQGNASTALGIDHHAEVPSLYDVVVEGTPLADVLQQCPDVANLWCAPATIDLAGAEIELVSMVAREVRLQKALGAYLNERRSKGLPQVDYVFIDCPPSLSLLTINAFVAAQEVLIPIQCEYYALEGLSQLLKHIDLIRGHLNPGLHVSTILLTMYDGRTRLSSQVANEVRTHFADVVVKTSVPRSVRISEAPSHSQTVMTYDPASSGALSYLEAARELAEQVLTWATHAVQEEQK
jgi:chromosome partitioning protein